MTEIADLVAALAAASPSSRLRLRQGAIQSIQSDGTVTITIAGGTTEIAGIPVASSCCPIPGAGCWILTDGRDMLVIATQARIAELLLTRTTAQAIATGTWAAITWTAEASDPAGMWASGSTATVITPGLYQLTAQATWPASTTGLRGLRVAVNGTPIATDTRLPANATHTAGVAALGRLAAADTITVEVLQDTGGSVDLTSAAFGAARVGP